jgi:hypothetical protein
MRSLTTAITCLSPEKPAGGSSYAVLGNTHIRVRSNLRV